jgi:hypothetical protein
MLASLKEQGLDRLDPVRFCYLQALLRRAEGQPAAARALVLRRCQDEAERLRAMWPIRAQAVQQAGEGQGETLSALPQTRAVHGSPHEPQRPFIATASPLGALLAHLTAAGAGLEAPCGESPGDASAQPQVGAHEGAASAVAPSTGLKAVKHFRRTWKRLNAEQRLAQSRAALPQNAGPLNSPHLVHRALQQLRDLSPAYFERFVAQVDGLLWLEQALGEPLKEASSGGGRGRR